MNVSLCMIVKNEADNLPLCLKPVAHLFQEIIVVDTGSTDETREVAAALGAKVFDFPWCDDFAAARNHSLEQAQGDWIFWLDADDRIDAENIARLHALLQGLRDDNAAYVMKCRSVENGGLTETDHFRLFRNRPDFRWRYRIHEQITSAIQRCGASIRLSDVVVHHTGYQDPALLARKMERNLKLLQLAYAEFPEDPWSLLNLGQTYLGLGRSAEALPLLKRCIDLSNPFDLHARKLYGQIARAYYQTQQKNEAVQVCRKGRELYPDFAELLFLESQLLSELGDLAGAEACLQRLIQPDAKFVSGDLGLCGFKARQNLGVLYLRQNRLQEAEAQFRSVVSERPDFLPAWLAIGNLWSSQGRTAELQQAVQQLQGKPYGPPIIGRLMPLIEKSKTT